MERDVARICAAIEQYLLKEREGVRKRSLPADVSLIEAGILDSLMLAQLVEFLERTFGVDTSPDDLIPDNFETLSRIARYVVSRGGA